METGTYKGPDLTLILSADGVIQDASAGAELADESLGEWIGQPWEATVKDVGPKKVRRLLETARERRVGGFSQINQRLPSGREILMEFSAVRSDTGEAGIVAIGKNLGLVVEQHQKLVAAQQAIEVNYWKLRDIESRYQAIIRSTSEAVVVVREDDRVIVEANPLARDLLQLPAQEELHVPLSLGADTVRIENVLKEIRKSGQAPSALVHLNPHRELWRVKATAVRGMQERLVLLQFVRANAPVRVSAAPLSPVPVRTSTSVVVVDAKGSILMASESFAELTGFVSASDHMGENVGRWLADLNIESLDRSVNHHEFELQLDSKRHGSRKLKVLAHPLTTASGGEFALTIEVPSPVPKIH